MPVTCAVPKLFLSAIAHVDAATRSIASFLFGNLLFLIESISALFALIRCSAGLKFSYGKLTGVVLKLFLWESSLLFFQVFSTWQQLC